MVMKPLKVCRSGRHDLTQEENVFWDNRGRRRGCLVCKKEGRVLWQQRNLNSARKSRFRIQYGMTVEEYDEVYDAQGGRCKICLNPGKRYWLCLDHCHRSGKIRGILCRPCNNMLGCAKDVPEILRRAALYLEQK